MLTLPLLKLSYATDPVSTVDNFSWTHTQHSLQVVFDRFRSASNMMTMKIFQASNILV